MSHYSYTLFHEYIYRIFIIVHLKYSLYINLYINLHYVTNHCTSLLKKKKKSARISSVLNANNSQFQQYKFFIQISEETQ